MMAGLDINMCMGPRVLMLHHLKEFAAALGEQIDAHFDRFDTFWYCEMPPPGREGPFSDT